MIEPRFFDDVLPVEPVSHSGLDVHSLTSVRLPAVIFVHGGPVPEGSSPKDSEMYRGYGSLAARSGLVGVTFNHGLHSDAHFPQAADNLAAAVERVRGLDTVDPGRILLWHFSAGGALSAAWLREPPDWLRGIALTYPALAAPPNWPGDAPRFDAVSAVSKHPALPKLLTRVDGELEFLSETQDAFTAAARAVDADLEVLEVGKAPHGFETQGPHADGRAAVDRAMSWVAATLTR
ncbi:alpha/beta hydrolase [Prauserella cavernicola]|uniref:Alpha/beta hydrolase fold domain-containing protein n=1 Tax=Prauserella cavernicola TaxID=2800127 RepID=A0A934V4H2_9PSEU|nr:alpha/beta hydrolase fold domain-containing protein [Prauserella cavernicola]MBK1784105.1 alpha/beta hydrolase fold domain-containing protein [Prauserella cavernicola]